MLRQYYRGVAEKIDRCTELPHLHDYPKIKNHFENHLGQALANGKSVQSYHTAFTYNHKIRGRDGGPHLQHEFGKNFELYILKSRDALLKSLNNNSLPDPATMSKFDRARSRYRWGDSSELQTFLASFLAQAPVSPAVWRPVWLLVETGPGYRTHWANLGTDLPERLNIPDLMDETYLFRATSAVDPNDPNATAPLREPSALDPTWEDLRDRWEPGGWTQPSNGRYDKKGCREVVSRGLTFGDLEVVV